MEKINITGNPDTNVDWYADGERANAEVLNRPIKQLAGFVNTLIDDHNSVELRPNIKPILNLDFANGKSVDPRVTFTRPTIATYFDQNGILRIAQRNEPRIDYDPITGECKGLLIEEQRTNLLLYSADFTQSDWRKFNVTVTTGEVAPDGSVATKLVCDTTADSEHYIEQFMTLTLGNETYTQSVFVKPAEFTFICLRPVHEGAAQGDTTPILFDLAAGKVVTSVPSHASAGIIPVGNGWYRCWVTFTVSGITSSVRSRIQLYYNGSNSLIFTGDGTSGVYIWGAQFEKGEFPTSYIPTNGTQVTRAADSAVMTDANFSSWYNPNEGTFFADASVDAFSKNSLQEHRALYVQRTDTRFAFNAFKLGAYSDGTGKLFVDEISSSNGVVVADFAGLNYVTSPVSFKEALSYNANSFSFSANGSIEKDGDVSLPVGLDRMTIGSTNIHIKRIAYWPKRLPNETLQVLTKD